MCKNILITGINGFVGNNFYKYFFIKFQLFGLDISNKDKISLNKFFYWNDLDHIPTINTIIHLAGKAHDTKNTSSEHEYFNINVGLTQKIFQHFIRSSATKFIFFSSVKAVADSVTSDQLTEEVLTNPQTPYGRSKLEAEKYIQNELAKWEKEETARGKDSTWKKVYILRPCMIHGEGNKGNLNLLYNFVKRGIPFPLGKFENLRSFTSIDNLLYILENIIEREDILPGVYNIADDDPISTNTLIHLIAKSMNKKEKIIYINRSIVNFIARITDSLHIPFNSETLKKLTESYVVSNQKIKNALGIKQLPINSEEGMMKTLRSFNS